MGAITKSCKDSKYASYYYKASKKKYKGYYGYYPIVTTPRPTFAPTIPGQTNAPTVRPTQSVDGVGWKSVKEAKKSKKGGYYAPTKVPLPYQKTWKYIKKQQE